MGVEYDTHRIIIILELDSVLLRGTHGLQSIVT